MRKLLLTVAAMALAVGVRAAPTEVLEILPGSNDPSAVINVSSGIAVTAVTVSSTCTSATQLDSVVATALTTLGATAQQVHIGVQNNAATALYVNYTASWTSTATGGWNIPAGGLMSFAVGKTIHHYGCQTAGGAGEARVGALAYKK